MRKRVSTILLGCLVLVGANWPKQAFSLDFSFLGVVNLTNYRLDSSVTAPETTGVAFGAGGTVSYDLSPFFSIETGALFLTHNFSIQTGVPAQSFNYLYMDIPLWLKASPLPLLSAYLGPYYGLGLSNNVGSNLNDFGLMAGVSFRIPMLPLVKLRMDGLYQYGLVSLNPGSGYAPQYSRNFAFMIGPLVELW